MQQVTYSPTVVIASFLSASKYLFPFCSSILLEAFSYLCSLHYPETRSCLGAKV